MPPPESLIEKKVPTGPRPFVPDFVLENLAQNKSSPVEYLRAIKDYYDPKGNLVLEIGTPHEGKRGIGIYPEQLQDNLWRIIATRGLIKSQLRAASEKEKKETNDLLASIVTRDLEAYLSLEHIKNFDKAVDLTNYRRSTQLFVGEFQPVITNLLASGKITLSRADQKILVEKLGVDPHLLPMPFADVVAKSKIPHGYHLPEAKTREERIEQARRKATPQQQKYPRAFRGGVETKNREDRAVSVFVAMTILAGACLSPKINEAAFRFARFLTDPEVIRQSINQRIIDIQNLFPVEKQSGAIPLGPDIEKLRVEKTAVAFRDAGTTKIKGPKGVFLEGVYRVKADTLETLNFDSKSWIFDPYKITDG